MILMYVLPSTLVIYFLPLQEVFLGYIIHITPYLFWLLVFFYLQSTAVLFNALLMLLRAFCHLPFLCHITPSCSFHTYITTRLSQSPIPCWYLVEIEWGARWDDPTAFFRLYNLSPNNFLPLCLQAIWVLKIRHDCWRKGIFRLTFSTLKPWVTPRRKHKHNKVLKDLFNAHSYLRPFKITYEKNLSF